MATKITGYKIFRSTGGNKCVQCGTRMRKNMPYMSPVTGKRVIHELTGKSICVCCIDELSERTKDILISLSAKELDLFQKKRFIEHLG